MTQIHEVDTAPWVPRRGETLLGRLQELARSRGDEESLRFVRFGAPDIACSLRELMERSAPVAARIAERARPRGADASFGFPVPVVITALDPYPTVLAFLAALRAGTAPLILAPPNALGGDGAFGQRVASVTGRLGGRCVRVSDASLGVSLGPGDDPLVLDETALFGTVPETEPPVVDPGGPDDVVFFQMTSASTGDGSLVAISNDNVLTNVHGIRAGLGGGAHERMCGWLPLYHDMGLIGTLLLSVLHGWPLRLLAPAAFVRRPARWLQAMSDHGATITTAPNFGYDQAWQQPTDAELEGVDLSRLRLVVTGAEPIRKSTLDGFCRRLAPYGFRAESFAPAFGLAESTLATTLHRPGRLPWFVRVDPIGLKPGRPVPLLGEGVLSVPDEDDRGVAVFALGPALPDLGLGLVDDEGVAIDGDLVLGEIVLRGRSVCVGRLENAERGLVRTHGGPLSTGDLGFTFRGDLFVLERKKHVIIRYGRNYLASLLEEQVAAVLDHPVHQLMVLDLDITDPVSPICVVLERFRGAPDLTPQQHRALRGLELPVDRLLSARRRILPRTTSGKKRYHLVRELARAGELKVEETLELR
ncbi:hypothetical protein GCM10022223_69860 [Kineosporia mesophila]|uniref:AMP-dependent synthetase/ligase domain-containing protein n=1 Tax=Kineosporia mesophila TaxID=566012 RepID=A0ABP7AV98_9ACTN|nr:AMP-binding protein [Kineosporia mesophila]